MITLDCKQGSPEWQDARLGIPTASQFDKIITPKTLVPSKSAISYMYELVAEQLLGEPLDDAASDFMVRGTALESAAVTWYEFEAEVDTTEVGFCLRDDRLVGCSPDRLVGDKGGLEIKCPAPENHVMYLADPDIMVAKYRCQVQGGLWLCERDWWDLVSYHPTIAPVRVRVQRDEKFIAALAECMESFLGKLQEARQKVEALAA
jgi:hypothetical protein